MGVDKKRLYGRLRGEEGQAYRSVDGLPVLMEAWPDDIRHQNASAAVGVGEDTRIMSRLEANGGEGWHVNVAAEVEDAREGEGGGAYEEEMIEKEEMEVYDGYEGDDDFARTGGDELAMSGTWATGPTLLNMTNLQSAGREKVAEVENIGSAQEQGETGRYVEEWRSSRESVRGAEDLQKMRTNQGTALRVQEGVGTAMLRDSREEAKAREQTMLDDEEDGLSTTAGSSVLSDTLKERIFTHLESASSVSIQLGEALREDEFRAEGGNAADDYEDSKHPEIQEPKLGIIDVERQPEEGSEDVPIFSGRRVGTTAEVSVRAKG